ncbi:MAG TPA: hypothetical protein PKW33_16395 [Anaerolineaceae bacterium]|nr:hypothetical protein [Anaerolineaceae bacterium]HPN53179.1 hypothetical protein [Anaerolineaceae bacterium]
MATREERMKILQMVQEGKITAQDAAQLLEAIDANAPRTPAVPARPAAPIRPRWFRVRVTDLETGKTRVNLRLPLNLVSQGMKMGTFSAPEIEGLDPKRLKAFLDSGQIGKMIDLIDDEDGEHVEVFIE